MSPSCGYYGGPGAHGGGQRLPQACGRRRVLLVAAKRRFDRRHIQGPIRRGRLLRWPAQHGHRGTGRRLVPPALRHVVTGGVLTRQGILSRSQTSWGPPAPPLGPQWPACRPRKRRWPHPRLNPIRGGTASRCRSLRDGHRPQPPQRRPQNPLPAAAAREAVRPPFSGFDPPLFLGLPLRVERVRPRALTAPSPLLPSNLDPRRIAEARGTGWLASWRSGCAEAEVRGGPTRSLPPSLLFPHPPSCIAVWRRTARAPGSPAGASGST